MAYWIMIFTQQPLGPFYQGEMVTALREASFSTLCTQYGLDPGLIQPALDQLAVEITDNDHLPLFFLRYQPIHCPPIVVTEWPVASDGGRGLLAEVVEGVPLPDDCSSLDETRFIYSVELEKTQLENMGLLLAYEAARWVMRQVGGCMLGLDRTWYRLNDYQAFLPLPVADR